ncbi:MAG: hypothetical protein AAF990_08780, partial [Bacteroidota bacterium]
MRIFNLLLVGSFLCLLMACGGDQSETPPEKVAQAEEVSEVEEVNPNFQEDARSSEWVHRSMQKLTDVIVHDIFSPPVASRIYAYPSIAAYEVMRQDNPSHRTLAGQLNGLTPIPAPEQGKVYCYPLAGIQAFLQCGKALIFSEDKIEAYQQEMMAHFKSLKMPSDVFERSIAYGNRASKHILAWADKDNYKETRTFPKYSIPTEERKWKPTPPDYMDGIEPHWMKIRTFALDSAKQFKPLPPTPVSMEKNSQFYKETMEVYNAVRKNKEERLAIASFWDCNPYVSHHIGHVMYATKKITPGGHWIG